MKSCLFVLVTIFVWESGASNSLSKEGSGVGSGEGSGSIELSKELCQTDPEYNLNAAQYEKVGCFHRNSNKFGEMLVNYRDRKGTELDWNDFPKSMQRLACECGYEASRQGYKYFSIGFYGECHGSNSIHSVDDRSLNCINDYASRCDETNEENTVICAGKASAEFVYKL